MCVIEWVKLGKGLQGMKRLLSPLHKEKGQFVAKEPVSQKVVAKSDIFFYDEYGYKENESIDFHERFIVKLLVDGWTPIEGTNLDAWNWYRMKFRRPKT